MEEGGEPELKSKVLYVDDERQNLISFKASFRKAYEVLIANSAEEALDILQEHTDISVVISDQRMPRMTGVELLEIVRNRYPDIIRIVLTGYSDIQDIINAISRGEVYRYITKPWNRDELKVTIDNAIEAYRLKIENRRLFHDLKEAYAQLEEDAKLLEMKVAERTQELAEKNHILEQQKQQLEVSQQDIKKQKIALQRQNENLIALNSEKNHLIGIVAHDLKAPLNQIQGLVELISMDEETLNEEQEGYLSLISQSLMRQQEMIMQILDLNAIESKKPNLNILETDVSELLAEVAERFILSAQKKDIALALDIDEGLQAMVDENYFLQIFQNLISNAIKFSPAHTQVLVRLHRQQDKIRACIKDQGPGISEEDQRKLFGRFQRLSAKPTGGEHSTGLGLSIVKRLVEDLGARIWCESILGDGATFIVEFDAVLPRQ